MAPPGRGDPPGRKRSRLKIQLRLTDKPDRPTKQQIFETVSTKLKGFLTALTETDFGFIAYTDLNSTIDALTSSKGKTELKKLKLETVTPPEIRAKRTLFIRGLDYTVGQRDAKDIETELTLRQPWLTDITVNKVKTYTHVIKLTCSDTSQAERLLRDGLTAFHTRIPPTNVETERWTPILICFSCYKFEDHSTNHCTSKTIICSECAETGHKHFDCKSQTKRCINCPTNDNHHRTLAPSCPYRKRVTKEKERQKEDDIQKTETQTYAKIVKTTIEQTAPAPRPTINLTDKTDLKIVLLTIEAHIAALSGDRPYNEILAESFKLNYDIDVKLPDRDSQKILNMYLKTDKTADKQDHTETESETDSDIDCLATDSVAPTPAPSPTRRQDTPAVKPKRRMTPPERRQDAKHRKTILTHATAKDIPEPYTIKVFRSDKDEEPLPTTCDTDWIDRQINGRKRYGLKIHIHGDIDLFKQHYRSGLLIIRRDEIKTIDDNSFQNFQRLTHYERKT